MIRTTQRAIGLMLVIMMLFAIMPASIMATTDDTTTEPVETPEELPAETPIPDAPDVATPTSVEPTPLPEEPGTEEPESTPQVPEEGLLPDETEPGEGREESVEGIQVTPEFIKVVDGPLVQVVYHYYDALPGQSVRAFSDYSIVSSHSYYALALMGEAGMEVVANQHVGTVQVSAAPLQFRVLLNAGTAQEQDITAYAAYSGGVVTLSEMFMGHALTVEWYRPVTEIVELPVTATICVGRGGAYTTTTQRLTLASNANEISIPVSDSGNVVVSQCGIDLPPSRYSLVDGMLHIRASALGGDIAVSINTPAAAQRSGISLFAADFTSVTHTRSSNQIYYGYYTSYYTANGNTAFCLDPTVSGLNSGTYPVSRFLVRGQDDALIKCAYYLYGGPGYDAIKGALFSDPDSMTSYGLCHAAASYVYMRDDDAFKGLSSSTKAQLLTLIDFITTRPMPPAGFDAFLYNAGSSTSQPLMGWDYTPGEDPEPDPDPEPQFGDLEIMKVSNNPAATSDNSCYSLAGAVFDVYDGATKIGTITTDSSGRGRLTGLPVGSGYSIVEVSPPQGFAINPAMARVNFTITSNWTTTVQVVNLAQGDPTTILLRKKDAQLPEGQQQGGASLAGAQFTIKYYKGLYTTQSALSGQTPYRTWVVRTDADGFAMLHPSYLVSGDPLFYDSSGSIPTLPLGTVTIQETMPPEGYLINDELFIRTVTADGQMEAVNTYNEPIVPENVIRGGVSIEKWDIELNRRADAQGDATLENAVFKIYNRTGSIVIVNNQTYANNEVVHTMVTNAEGVASTANDLLPYGRYEIVEETSPSGYLNTGVIRQFFNITDHGVVVSLKTSLTAIKNNVIRGGVDIEKWDIERDERTLKQGDAVLEGAVFEIWNRSRNSVLVEGTEYASNTVVYTMTTDAAGWAGTAADLLPFGSYEIIEASSPLGYLNTGIIKQSFQIREHGVVVSMLDSDQVIKNNIIRGGVRVEKWDNEIDEHRAQGGATLEGAIFEIVNRSADSVLIMDQLYAFDEVVYTFTTDETGSALTSKDLLPFGTYLVREVSPPSGYLATGVLSQVFTIREHGKIVELDTSETAIKNDPIRGDLKGVKIADGDAGRLAGVPFKITSKTTGESHVVVTDQNGMFDTSTSWNPHSQNTNRGETDRDGVWFGELRVLNDELGALLYDTYILEELSCAANADKQLLSFEVSVYRHMTVVDLGTLTNDYIPQPEIFTTAMGKETTAGDAIVAETTTILDTVYYSGLTIGNEYTLKGVLMDKATGEPLLVDGEQVTAQTSFHAAAESGSVPMEFVINTLALKGKNVVVFESLELDGIEIAAHADIEDEGQTVTFHEPKIGTKATGPNGAKELDESEQVTITDMVSYEGLIPGKTYTVKGTLMDKATGQPLLVDGKAVTAEKTFEPQTASGTVEVPFTFNALALQGKSVVVFESLQYVNREVAVHADINDADQTVRFKEPRIGTSASGQNGEKDLAIQAQTTIIDVVSYEDLMPGKPYTLKGVLMDKSTGQPLLLDGKEVTAEVSFTPAASSGQVNVAFTLNSLSLRGKEVVVFERLYSEGVEIAVHADITDAGQTVRFKGISIRTSATSEDGKKIIPVMEDAKIIDTVTYEGLAVGEQYTLKGILMNKHTGQQLLLDGKAITAETTFIPGAASGSIQVVFTLDTLNLEGVDIVVFESLEYQGKVVASHADINDTDQTVEVRKRSIPKTGDENNLLLWLILLGVGAAGIGAGLWLMIRRRNDSFEDEPADIE